MKVLIGCDVDPLLPAVVERPSAGDIWEPLQRVRKLLQEGDALPPITWLIRSDDSVRFATGDFASGYLRDIGLWQQLADLGHEIGWHMHLLSFKDAAGHFSFDPDPSWLSAAYEALARHVTVRATRTGWDYGSNVLFRKLDQLGIRIDLSALPGSIAYLQAGTDPLVVDWLRCPAEPYFPCADDYQGRGQPALRMLEVPITQFQNSPVGMLRRLAGRLRQGVFDLRGLHSKSHTLTARWNHLPRTPCGAYVFYFHPEELAGEGMHNLIRNIALLRQTAGAEFVTGSQFLQGFLDGSGTPTDNERSA